MPLPAGTRFGVFEITAAIGFGGMGEVYRATDTNLKRQVALKVLPTSFADDSQRLARFQREAEILAALNHPNIAHIHGLEKADGTVALVMELVEGPTLADQLAKGAIPIDEALAIAKQIAEALEAAHEQGIVHRDLKPANIKVRDDGTVKVLDFGLAKATDPVGALTAISSMSPTITTPAMTQTGMILGTAAYMSPEQARGKMVDRRADVWAFGAVLFEMLTGRRAFPGDDVSDTLAAVLRAEPDWTQVPRAISPTLLVFLRRTLEKDPRQRVGDIRDVRLALDGAFEPAGPPAAATRPSTRGSRVAWLIAATAVFAVAALALPAVKHLRETSPLETRVDLVTPATSDPVSFALSPDGRQIVFVGSADGGSRLWLRSLSSTSAQPLAGTDGAAYPFWSPDSGSLAFFADGQLKRLDLGGGAPRVLAAARAARGGTWNAAGVILFAPNIASPLFRVSAAGGEAAPLTKLNRQVSHRFPIFLPDGRHFLFYGSGETDTSGIYLGTLEEEATTRVVAAETAGVYLPSGWLLWVRAGTLVAQRLDLDRRALTGDPITVADAVAVNGSYFGGMSVSATGVVAYRRRGTGERRQLTWFDQTGKALGTLGEPDSTLTAPSVSPDGRRVAFSRSVQDNKDLWILDGTRATRLTFDLGRDDNPIWSPDGRQIVFASIRKGPYEMYLKAASSEGEDERLVDSSQNTVATDWSSDGRFLLYTVRDPQTDQDFWVRPMTGDRTPWMFLKTPFSEDAGRFSPDGRWVAYMSNESGRMEIYVRPFARPLSSGSTVKSAATRQQVSSAGGTHPSWRSDGRELYYIAPAGTLMAVPFTIGTSGAADPGTPVALFSPRLAGDGFDRQYDVTRDGRFLVNTVLDDAVAAPITLIQNWRPQ